VETLQALRGKLDSAGQLHTIVRTMKGLAAVNIRQYQLAVESLRQYTQTLQRGLQVLLQARSPMQIHRQEPLGGPIVAVLFGSDQGMVGQFNRRIMQHARTYLAEHHRDQEVQALGVGRRLAGAMSFGGWDVRSQFALPRSVEAITGSSRDVLLRIQDLRSGGAARVVLFHHSPRGQAAYEPRTWWVYPLDLDWLRELSDRPWPTRQVPMFREDPQSLFAALVRMHLLASLYRAFAESLAAENASRLASMQAAENNIEDRKARLREQYQRRRQSKITEELLDVMAGFEASQSG
jgi:F-type H+-transporting ATPase subunit gamma